MTQNSDSATNVPKRQQAPSTLWHQALEKHPNDADARRELFHQLMVDEGHIVPADHPDAGAKNLPCGWPVRSA